MNAHVRKEIRLLRPTFLIGALAVVFAWLLPFGERSSGFWPMLRSTVTFVVCPAMAVMLALESFGAEINAKTFSQLLTQSISRRRIWWTKVSLLAGAALSFWAIWFFSLMVLGKITGTNHFASGNHMMAAVSLLFLWAVFSGGLWTVLLFRQVGVAFWVTILVPFALCLGTYSQLENWDPHRANVFVATLFVVYGFLGFFFAHWLFLRAQDLQWAGGVIALPKWRSRPRVREDAPSARRYRPRLAVINREFQLQQSQLIVAAFLCVLHLAAIAARNFIHGILAHGGLDALVHAFWGLWLLMPVLIGCGAIAEERKLGTLQGQLCIPATHRFQFFTKLGVVVFLSVLFGVLLPTILESIDGAQILGNAHASNDWLPDFHPVIFWNWIVLTPIAVASGLVSFYFSSLCNNTLKALAPSILALMVIGFVLAISVVPEEAIGIALWRGFIGNLIGIPILGFVGLWLAYLNYRNLQRGLALWNRNLGGFTLALVFSVATAAGLYHRVWERLLPLEPRHGPARLDSAARPEFKRHMGSIFVKLPDGQVWQGNFGYSLANFFQLLASNWRLEQLSGGSGFIKGTNWSQVADCLFDTVGIQNDGSLWVSRKRLPVEFNRVYLQKDTVQPRQKEKASDAGLLSFERIGEGRDWKSVVATGRDGFLLKQDGTLWTWSTNGISVTNWPGLAALQLKQVGRDSDWAELRNVSSHYIYLRKKDGRVWSNLEFVQGTADSVSSQDQALIRAAFLDGHDWLGLAMVEYPAENPALPIGFFNRYVVGIRDDGTFRLMAGFLNSNARDIYPVNRDARWNPGTNWISLAAFQTGEAVLLKSDGSLWRWNVPPDENGNQEGLTRIGTRSDWRAIAADEVDLLALSADGSIWAWRKDPEWESVGREFHVAPLIQVSRRPQFVANIFGSKP